MRITEIVLGIAALMILAGETLSTWLDAPTMVTVTGSEWPIAFCLLLTATDIAIAAWYFTPAKDSARK